MTKKVTHINAYPESHDSEITVTFQTGQGLYGDSELFDFFLSNEQAEALIARIRLALTRNGQPDIQLERLIYAEANRTHPKDILVVGSGNIILDDKDFG